jgi:hypothetical protein
VGGRGIKWYLLKRITLLSYTVAVVSRRNQGVLLFVGGGTLLLVTAARLLHHVVLAHDWLRELPYLAVASVRSPNPLLKVNWHLCRTECHNLQIVGRKKVSHF